MVGEEENFESIQYLEPEMFKESLPAPQGTDRLISNAFAKQRWDDLEDVILPNSARTPKPFSKWQWEPALRKIKPVDMTKLSQQVRIKVKDYIPKQRKVLVVP